MKNATVMVFLLLTLLAGGILLQIILSKKKSKWFGLILPSVTFFYSVLMVAGLAAYSGMSGGQVFAQILTTFLAGNIPTIVLVGIYLGCREKMRQRAELDKMNIQDLL